MPHREIKLEDVIPVDPFNVIVVGVEVVINSVRELVDWSDSITTHVLDVFSFKSNV